MKTHPIQWQAPQPLWGRFGATVAQGATAADQQRPAILRFASDEFMEQILATLARDPAQIGHLVARPESWRTPMAAQADLVERTPIPRITQSALRNTLALKTKTSIAVTAPEVAAVATPTPTLKLPLKLYQPAHQRYYLVASSLVCAQAGFPERAVVPGAAEQVNFVIRRLMPATPGSTQTDDLREFAYVKDAYGAHWQRVAQDSSVDLNVVPSAVPNAVPIADAQPLVAGEELLPVFPLGYQDDNQQGRKLWSGFVPVGRREEYVSATVVRSAAPVFSLGQRQSLVTSAPVTPNSKLARVAQFQMEVAEPWKNLIRSSVKASESQSEPVTIGGEFEPTVPDNKRKRLFEFNLQQQNVSWLILLDFADYLSTHLEDLWHAIENSGAGFDALSTPRKDLYTWLGSADMPSGLQTALKATDAAAAFRPPLASMQAALIAIRAPGVREKLEATELSYTNNSASLGSSDWPPFHFVLAGLDTSNVATGPFVDLDTLSAASSPEFEPDPLISPAFAQDQAAKVDKLTALIGRALVESQESNAPPVPFALQVKNAIAANVGDAGWFVVRFVYLRRDCGPLHAPLLSAPTQRFQLASFFDSDAPARPIRIALPLDTSPAGLRKFNKNTAFVLSDMLCGQVQRAKGLGLVDLVRSVLPWPLHKDLDVGAGGSCNNGASLSLGMICSISIPIITICALILLMIIVSLLDFIFRWLPYFVICFPVPKLKGKP